MRFLSVKERNYMYLSKLIGTLLKSREGFDKFRNYKIYQINLNVNVGDRYTKIRYVKNIYLDNNKDYIPNVTILEIGLEYFYNLLYTEDAVIDEKSYIFASFQSKTLEELESILDKFLSKEEKNYVMKEVKIMLDDFEIVFTEDEVATLDAIQMAAYNEDMEKMKKSVFKKAKKGGFQDEVKELFINATSAGKNEGKAEGIIEGRTEGRIEGRIEGKRESKIEIAKNLLAEKVSLDIIKKSTGLSMKAIKSLML